MKIYNSITRKKEEFIPLDEKNVKMYACGITVYDLSHIGHAKQAIVYAMIADYLRYRGYNVKYVRNYTDVDDKIIKRANEKSLCLDLGTGGGEKVLKRYPKVGMLIATDFSKEMIYTVKENAKKYSEKNIKFGVMDNLKMTFPGELFDLVSARHTVINAKRIYKCLTRCGTLVIEGVDQKDCWELKKYLEKVKLTNIKRQYQKKTMKIW